MKDGATDASAVGYWRFIADLSQPAWLSVEGVVLVLLVLLSLAYIEQFARSLWRGRRRPSATVGLAIFAALLAVTVVGIAWLAAGQQPTLAGAVVCAALGAFRALPWPSGCTGAVACAGCAAGQPGAPVGGRTAWPGGPLEPSAASHCPGRARCHRAEASWVLGLKATT